MNEFWIGLGIAWVATVLWMFWCDDGELHVGYGSIPDKKEKADDTADRE